MLFPNLTHPFMKDDRIQRDKINCVVAVTFNSRKGSMHHSKSFTLIGGTSNGQLININLSQEGKQEPIVQVKIKSNEFLNYT